MACALCGPDSEFGDSSKVTSKFLDFGKLTSDHYLHEGIHICVKWYIGVLEGRTNKKDTNFLKLL